MPVEVHGGVYCLFSAQKEGRFSSTVKSLEAKWTLIKVPVQIDYLSC